MAASDAGPRIDPRAALRDLLRERAVLRGDFVLSSGRRSTHYLDARRVTLSAAGSPLVGRLFLDLVGDVDAIGGPGVGADPIVAAVATTAGLVGRQIDALIVRKAAKDHGTGGRIVGPWRPGMRVAIVDDTVTTGGSLVDAASAILEAGGSVTAVYALIDREEGGREAIEDAGYRLHTIFTADEILGTPS